MDKKIRLLIELVMNNKSFNASVAGAEGSIDGLSKKTSKFGTVAGAVFKGVGIAAAAVAAAMISMSVRGVAAASALEESTGKFSVVFSEVRKEADAMAKNLVQNFGTSQRAAQDMLSGTGDLLAGFGFTQQAALSLSNEIAMLGSDMASFQNLQGGAEEAVHRLTSGILGETEGLKALGIKVEQSSKQFKDQVKALRQSTGATEAQAKALLILEQVAQQSGNSVGDLSRTATSFSNVSRQIASRMEQIFSNFGAPLLEPLGHLGKAFLDATGPGTVFANAMKEISLMVAVTINKLTALINKLNEAAAKGQVETFGKSIQSAEKFNSQISAAKANIEGLYRKMGQETDFEKRGELAQQIQVAKENLEVLVSENRRASKAIADNRITAMKALPGEIEKIEANISDLQLKADSGTLSERKKALIELQKQQKLKAEYERRLANESSDSAISAEERSKESILGTISSLKTADTFSQEGRTATAEKESKKREDAEKAALNKIAADHTSWQAQYRDMWIMSSEQIANINNDLCENIQKQYIPLLKSLDDFIDISIGKWGEYASGVLSVAGQLTSAIDGYYSQLSSNQLDRLDYQYEQESEKRSEQLEKLNEDYDSRLELLDTQLQNELAAKGLASQTDAERAASEIEELRANIATTTDILKKDALQEQLTAKQKEEAKFKIEADYASRKAALEAKLAAEQKAIEDEQKAAEKEYEEQRKKIEKENFERQKRISAISTTISGAEGSVAAYKALSGIPFVGPALGAAAAATLLGFTAKQVSEINKQKYYATDGLIVPGSSYSGDKIDVGVNSGEAIFNKEQQAELWKVANGQGAATGNTFNFCFEIGDQIIYKTVNTGIESHDIRIRLSDIMRG